MATLVNYKCKSFFKLIPDYANASQLPYPFSVQPMHVIIGFTLEQIMWTSLGLFVPFWVTTVHTVTDWFLYRHKNRFSLVWTYPQTVATFAYVMNETPLSCGSALLGTWKRPKKRREETALLGTWQPIVQFLTTLPPWFHLEPANWQMLRQPTSGK